MLRKRYLFASAFGLIIVIDQLSKWWHDRGGDISYNTGISLGLFSVLPPEVLTLILVAVLAIVWWLYKDEWRASPIASGLFFGGGMSNLVDRLLVGSVRDWLPVPYMSLYNNLADYAIALGLIIVVINSLRKNYQLEVDESTNRQQHEEVE